jgi:hypothetical protein
MFGQHKIVLMLPVLLVAGYALSQEPLWAMSLGSNELSIRQRQPRLRRRS